MKHPASLHDILTAWQAGEIGYRTALDMTGIDTLGELYDAALMSGVAIQTSLTARESAVADRIAPLLRAQLLRRAA